MHLPRHITAARTRRAVVSFLAVLTAMSLTASTPIAIRRVSGGGATAGAAPASAAPLGIAVSRARGEAPVADLPPSPGAETPATRPASLPTTAPDEPSPFTIELPDGWSGGEIEAFDDDAARSFRYDDGSGRFFIVNIDPAGSDFEADEVWRYRVAGQNRFEVVAEDRCIPGEPLCGLGNGVLTIYAVWENGGSATVGGHAYYFRFGDDAGEIGGTRVFRDLLESIRVDA